MLVVNAGDPPAGTFDDFDDSERQAAFELTLMNPVRMIRAVLPFMRQEAGGSILAITSVSVKEPIDFLLLPNVMRSGVTSLAKSLSQQFASENIRGNNLMPGRIDTDRVQALDAMNAEAKDIPVEEIKTANELGIPLGRYGTVEEFGRLGAFSTNDFRLLGKMVAADAVEVVQFATNLLDEHSKVWKLCQENNLGTQLRGVMAQGRLSGKYFNRTPEFRPDDNRSTWCADEDYSRFAALGECLPEGMTMAQAAIRWILDHPGAHTICMGAKNIEDYRAAIAAAGMPPLEEDVCAEFERIASGL